MTQAEIVENIQQRADDFTADLTVDGKEYEPSLSDLGITVDAEATAEKALTSSADAWSRVKGLFDSSDVPLEVSLDEGVLDEYAEELVKALGEPAKNASVSFDPEAEAFTVEPASVGHGLEMEEFRNFAKSTAANLSEDAAEFTSLETEPEVSTEDAQKFADSANQLIAVPVSISTGNRTINPTIEERAKWVDLDTEDGMLDEAIIDEKAFKTGR